jgi:hypothetical protein
LVNLAYCAAVSLSCDEAHVVKRSLDARLGEDPARRSENKLAMPGVNSGRLGLAVLSVQLCEFVIVIFTPPHEN